MRGEARQQRLQVAARLAAAPLGGGRDRADEVGALEADRVVARAEEEPLDDPVEPRVRASRPWSGRRRSGAGGRPPRGSGCRRRSSRRRPLPRAGAGSARRGTSARSRRCPRPSRRTPAHRVAPELDVEQRHVAADGRRGDRPRRRVGERGRNLAGADPVPLDLAVGRPAVRRERLLPERRAAACQSRSRTATPPSAKNRRWESWPRLVEEEQSASYARES